MNANIKKAYPSVAPSHASKYPCGVFQSNGHLDDREKDVKILSCLIETGNELFHTNSVGGYKKNDSAPKSKI